MAAQSAACYMKSMKSGLDAFRDLRYTKTMISIQTKTHVGADGTLSVQVPTTLRETDVEVLLVFQPLPTPAEKSQLEASGWPPGFFEATAGAWKGEPLERAPQGEYEVRGTLE